MQSRVVALLGLPLLCAPLAGAAHAQDFDRMHIQKRVGADGVPEAVVSGFDNAPMARKIEFKVVGASLDDALIEMARVGNVNVMADATQFAGKARVSFEWSQTFGGLFNRIIFDSKLSRLRVGDRSFVLWNEPDLVTLSTRLAQGEGAALLAPGEPAPLKDLVRKYLQRQPKAEQESSTSNGALLQFADLPADLQGAIVDAARRRTVWSVSQKQSSLTTLFSDDAVLWQQVRLRLRPDRSLSGGKMQLEVSLYDRGNVAAGVSFPVAVPR